MVRLLGLRRVRESRYLSQDELAEKVGMNRPNITRLESGAQKARWSTVRALAKALGVSPDELVSETPRPAASLSLSPAL